MEESRLKPMAQGYDENLFNQLYKDTEGLRRKLASQIDHRRFGLAYEDILSFFNVKFIFCFNKHYDAPPEKLRAFLINSLRNFKCRILRAAYTKKFSQSIVSLDDLPPTEFDVAEDNQVKDYYLDKLMTFMKKHLSDDALLILEIQLNPPPFILARINPDREKPLQKIPDQVILDYLDLGFGDNAIKYLNHLKKEIKQAVIFAKNSLN